MMQDSAKEFLKSVVDRLSSNGYTFWITGDSEYRISGFFLSLFFDKAHSKWFIRVKFGRNKRDFDASCEIETIVKAIQNLFGDPDCEENGCNCSEKINRSCEGLK